MITSSFSGDLINASLRQMGAASIKEIRNGILYIIKFELTEELNVIYVLDVTKRDKFFLQRVSPYPMSHGRFSSPSEVVQFIRDDIHKFTNAKNSHNFPKFLLMADEVTRFSHAAELLFLEHNVSKSDLERISDCMQQAMNVLKDIHEHSPKIDSAKSNKTGI